MRYVFLAGFIALSLSSCTSDVPTPEATPSTTAVYERVPGTESGVTFVNHVEENFKNFFARFQYVYNGGGVAIGDVDGDGRDDLFFTANEQPDRLYRNTGDLTFTDVTDASGINAGINPGWHNGVVMADVNGDGHLDIYVCRGGSADGSSPEQRANLLYLNDGKGNFREAAAELGLADTGYSLQAVFFDSDNDNDLDAYVTNRPDRFFLGYQEVLRQKEAQPAAFSDRLYRNDGGKFVDVTTSAGITGNFGYGLGLVTTDVNNDGFTDLVVSNDYLENDYLYVNRGDGTFRESIAEYTNHGSFYGMGVDAVDLDHDGNEDLVQLDMSPEDYVRSKTTMASMNVDLYEEIMNAGFHDQYMHNSLQLNRGNGFFSEISQLAGVDKTDWSWACLGADFDNDGQRELFVSNGYRRDVADKDGNLRFQEYLRGTERNARTDEENAAHVIAMFKSVPLQNYLFDDAGPLRYRNAAAEWGLTETSFSNGAAYGDLDGDGDLDLVVNNLEGEAFLYRNKGAEGNHLRLRLRGPAGNTFGIGARVTLALADGSKQHQRVKTVRGYLSSVEPTVHFGLGEATDVARITVAWPDGRETTIAMPPVNELLTVDYAEAEIPGPQTVGKEPVLLRETTAARLATPFVHEENDFDDYRSQILLPHGHSHAGPAIAVGDVNGDGLEDFYVGGARKLAGVLYRQGADGRFTPETDAFVTEDAGHEDTDARFFDVDNDGDQDLYVVSGGSEFTPDSKWFQDRLYLNDGAGNFTQSGWLPEIRSSGSCVVPHDFDGDGDQDLFVGGRVVPTKYPAAPRSFLLENTGTEYLDVTADRAPELTAPGMVTSAVWEDLDGDGTAELFLVGEWMPLTVFSRDGETYRNATADYALENTQGWWNKLVAADVDGDGDTDFVAGNLGLNYKFHASAEKPFYVFATDFDRNGSNDIFLAKENGDELKPIRGRECSSQQVPGIADKFPSYNAFANADLEEIIDLERPDALRYEAREFASCWLENRDGQLTLHRLPLETQFSVVNAIVPADVNGDGRQDLVTAGNKFEVEIETTRADAGLGTLLLGGPTGFRTSPPAESGLSLPGNVKGLYSIGIGVDRSPGILVAVNEGRLRLLEY